ncbi:hypothetical protein DPMN_008019 [Dreissena polymorpha]|uniref:Uncharacterized protein n=1 Tax=Dreissena polymorpha TaxID=45954 RepID=A0A9D4MXA2_DREPO|nr:hypothetical protein DPMN_008019 [Dreissena polymorpha]
MNTKLLMCLLVSAAVLVASAPVANFTYYRVGRSRATQVTVTNIMADADALSDGDAVWDANGEAIVDGEANLMEHKCGEVFYYGLCNILIPLIAK